MKFEVLVDSQYMYSRKKSMITICGVGVRPWQRPRVSNWSQASQNTALQPEHANVAAAPQQQARAGADAACAVAGNGAGEG